MDDPEREVVRQKILLAVRMAERARDKAEAQRANQLFNEAQQQSRAAGFLARCTSSGVEFVPMRRAQDAAARI